MMYDKNMPYGEKVKFFREARSELSNTDGVVRVTFRLQRADDLSDVLEVSCDRSKRFSLAGALRGIPVQCIWISPSMQ